MSREIKFRAWSFDPVLDEPQMLSHEDLDRLDREGLEHLFDVINGKDKYIIPMQYTGLKDVNGKEVYEKDIVRGIVKDVHDIFDEKDFTLLDEVGVVKMKEGIWMLSNEKDEYAEGMLYKYDSIEIIGNIHQNPELL